MNNEISRWFAVQPFSTKWIAVASLVIPVLMKLTILPPHYIVFYWPNIWRKLQVWRIFTSLFITNVNLNFIFSLYFRYQYSAYLETIQFAGRPADYLYFLLLSVALMTALNAYLGMAVLWEALSMTIIYVWAQYNKAVNVTFMFGFRFPAMYLPAVMLVFDFVVGGNVKGTLVGIFVGHLYYFMREIYSRRYPAILAFLEAPAVLKRYVNRPAVVPGGSYSAGKGYTMYAPERPLGRAKADEARAEEAATFRPFSGTAKKLGAE